MKSVDLALMAFCYEILQSCLLEKNLAHTSELAKRGILQQRQQALKNMGQPGLESEIDGL